ncbi:MAG: DsbA family protein [Gammaproteobacteria bacterium]|nr:DsbA family protein [Gammaproteobacteria bacterium]
MTQTATLVYVHDPMCSWCWAFAPTFWQLSDQLPAAVSVRRLLGGLAADSDQPMPRDMRDYLQATWQRIAEQVPGTRFNADFWHNCEPRRSTWPACRAVIAVRRMDARLEEDMITAIQQAYYLQARNPSNTETLVELAIELGLDGDRFARLLDDQDTRGELSRERQQAHALGADSFPSLRLLIGTSAWQVPVDYSGTASMLDTMNSLLDMR